MGLQRHLNKGVNKHKQQNRGQVLASKETCLWFLACLPPGSYIFQKIVLLLVIRSLELPGNKVPGCRGPRTELLLLRAYLFTPGPWKDSFCVILLGQLHLTIEPLAFPRGLQFQVAPGKGEDILLEQSKNSSKKSFISLSVSQKHHLPLPTMDTKRN